MKEKKNHATPTILALDTSLSGCSVALLKNKKITEQFSISPQQHGKLILPYVENILQENHLSFSDIDALAYSCGPANFTGIRIAAAIIQGLSFGLNIPVIPISTLQVIAQGIHREYAAKQVLVCLDARMDEIYWGMYTLQNQFMISVTPDIIISTNHIEPIDSSLSWWGAGDGWHNYANLLQEKIKISPDKIKTDFNPHAQDIAFIAQNYFMEKKFIPTEMALPIYLRNTNGWKKIPQQLSKK